MQVIDGNDVINQRYLFPYNSSLRFGIVYCPGIKTESYIFEKVSDIIRSTDLPKVVACTKKVKNKSEKLEVNEILIVKEVRFRRGVSVTNTYVQPVIDVLCLKSSLVYSS